MLPAQQGFQVAAEALQRGDVLRGGFQDFLLVHEHPAAFPLHQRPQAFTYPPTDVAQNLQAFWPWNEKRDAIVPQDSYGFGKAVECLQFEAGEIKALELFFWKHREFTAKGAKYAKEQ